MERRRAKRWPRQLDASFLRRGDEAPFRGVVTNISITGAFVRAGTVSPPGTRIRLEIRHGGESFVQEAVVVRALRTPAHLQTVRPSGMGLRFLSPRELVEELLPNLAGLTTVEEIHLGPVHGPGGAAEERTAEPGAGSGGAEGAAGGDESVAAGAAPANVIIPPPLQRRPRPRRPAVAGFRIHFKDAANFRAVFERDVRTGGLFVPADSPPALQSLVMIEVEVEGSTAPPVQVEARVVHRLEPGGDGGAEGDNLLAGMGVQFTDVEGAVESLRSLLA